MAGVAGVAAGLTAVSTFLIILFPSQYFVLCCLPHSFNVDSSLALQLLFVEPNLKLILSFGPGIAGEGVIGLHSSVPPVKALSMRFFTLLFLTLLCTCVRAQSLTGRIVDADSGEPLPFATIYVENTKGGTASNADGYYQVKLGPGNNRLIFSYLGYTSRTETVSGTRNMDVELSTEALNLKQIEVVSSGEDISYSVIRRAIAKADYHLNQLDSYSAEVYIKGTGKVNKVPGLIRAMATKEERKEMDEEIRQPFTSESTSAVEYTRPNTYKQEVISAYSVGDNQFDANPYIFTSFYSPMVANQIVSPLSPRAFGYYKFVHEGVFADQGELINRIRVIPRSKGEDIFEGYINIVQDDWSLHSLDLTTYKLGFAINIKRTFAEVQEHTWMPITTTLDAEGKIFGFEFEYHYLSTISKYDLEMNPELGGYVEVIDAKTQPEQAAAAKKATPRSEMEEVLADGGELTAKNMRRLMRDYRKQEQKEADEPEVVRNSTFVSDSAKVITDSAAWAALRPVPLTALERRGYARIDSIQRLEKEAEAKVEMTVGSGSDDEKMKVKAAKKKRRVWSQNYFPAPIFSPVEGYALGVMAEWKRNTKKNPLRVAVQGRYGLGWERFIYQGALSGGRMDTAKVFSEQYRWKISGGQFLRQFDRNVPIGPWFNALTTLMGGNNYINYYERTYGELEINQQFGDRWAGYFRVGYEERESVVNSSNNNWYGLGDEEVYDDNAPVNTSLGRVTGVSPAFTTQVRAEWRPGLKFAVTNGNRQVLDRSAPTIGFELEQGIAGPGNSTADFTRLQASYKHRFQIGRRGDVDLMVRGGAFVNNASVDFPDYQHFATTEFFFTNPDPIANYRLLNYYQESTNQEYLEVYGHYQFRKFLLTQFNYLHLKGLKEDLFVNYLYTPTSENYTEIGYSLDNIFRFLRVEFVTSYRDFAYEDFGIRFSISSGLERLFNF